MSSVVRCGSLVRSRYLPSSLASAATFAASRRSSPPGVVRRNRCRPGAGGDHPAQLGPLGRGLSRSEPAIIASSRATSRSRGSRRPVGGVGVVADHEPLVLGDLDLLDPQVRADVLVAAWPGQRRGGLRRAGAQLLAEDVAVRAGGQVAAVGGGGEPAVGDPDHPAQGPVPQVVLDLADQRRVGGVARPAPHPHRDPVPGHGHPDHHLREVVAGVLGLAERAEPGLRRRARRRLRRRRPPRRPARRPVSPSVRGCSGRTRPFWSRQTGSSACSVSK